MDLAILRIHATKAVGSLVAGGIRGIAFFGIFGMIVGGTMFFVIQSVTKHSDGVGSFILMLAWIVVGLLLGGFIGFFRGLRGVCRQSLVKSHWVNDACDRLSRETIGRLRSPQKQSNLQVELKELVMTCQQEQELSDQHVKKDRATGGVVRRMVERITVLPQLAVRKCFTDLINQMSASIESDAALSALVDRFPEELKSRTNSLIDAWIKQIFARPLGIAYVVTGCAVVLLAILTVLI